MHHQDDTEFGHLLERATKSRNSIWELTWDARPLPPTDTIQPTLYEVGLGSHFTPTTPDVFAAWTGPRRLNGEDHHGPIYNLGTQVPYDGPRHCPCHTCEAGASPIHRKN